MSVQTPTGPGRSPFGRRYPMTVVTDARAIYGDGETWSVPALRDLLARKHDLPGLSINAVRRWVVPGVADAQRTANIEAYRAYRRPAEEDSATVKLRRRLSDREASLAACRARLIDVEQQLQFATVWLDELSPLGERDVEQTMLALRQRGLPYSAIVSVLDVYHGVRLSEHQVRSRLQRLGVPKMESRARAMRRQWAKVKQEEALGAVA